jgi:hypothetical protein
MAEKKKIDPDLAEACHDVLLELASELDLHYEDGDFFALSPSITRMRRLADMLEASGYELPEAYVHVLKRFHRHHQ